MQVSPILVALIIVAILADVLTVELPSVSVSITYPVLAATIMLLGAPTAGVVAGLSTIPAAFMVKEKAVVRGFFNSGQLALTYLCSGLIYAMAGGPELFGHPLSATSIPHAIVPLALLAIASFAVNTTLVGIGVTIKEGIPFTEVWKSSFAWTIPTQAALTILALALAQIVASEGTVGLALFVVPLLIAQQFYERYVRLRTAYRDTVKSLVAVIEAKDAYTRGHSERVAAYAVAIARQLGLDDQRVERIELAALLHDLGKVAVSRDILSKKSRLDDDEFRLIQAHPEVGARIIESVPFLSDLVPYIASHHERMDGSGYGEQLTGEQIPVEARLLSVADAFDAMTSSRPYRAALTHEATIAELRRCAGQQFDPVIVEVFIEALSSGTFQDSEHCAAVHDEAV
jgi:putative nucleotidyltransferase with HDIG domain